MRQAVGTHIERVTLNNTITIILLLFCKSILAQEYYKVDSIVKTYSPNIKTEELAKQICKDFESEDLKARAIFTWVSNNVQYDVKKYLKVKRQKKKTKKSKWINHYQYEKSVSKKTLRKGKGICGDYAVLYKHLCDLTGVDCVVISGYSKTENKDIGRKFGEKHAWNAVMINGEWNLVDATWGAGYVINESNKFVFQFNDYYFFTNPEYFFLRHFPRKTNWLFTEKTKEDFKNLPLYGHNYNHLDYETDKSHDGVILVQNDTINFEFKNAKSVSSIYYEFNNQGFGERITPNIEGEIFSFKVVCRKRRTDYLKIFINRHLYATYKVKAK